MPQDLLIESLNMLITQMLRVPDPAFVLQLQALLQRAETAKLIQAIAGTPYFRKPLMEDPGDVFNT